MIGLKHLSLLVFFCIPGLWVVRDYYGIPLPSPYLILVVLVVFPVLISCLRLRFSSRLLLLSLPIFLYSIYVLLVININNALYSDGNNLYADYFNYNLGALMACLLAFAIGLGLPRFFYIPVAISLLLYIPLINLLLDYRSMTLGDEFLASPSGSLYLNIADYFGLGALMLLSRIKGLWAAALFLLISCFLLMLYSRATFYIFIFVVGLFYVAIRPGRFVNLICVAVLVLFGLSFQSTEGRFISFLLNPTEDLSSVERFDQYMVGFNVISDNMLMGDYYSIPAFFGHYGGYIHGILSHYQVYGLLPFVLLMLCYFYLASVYLKAVFKKDKNSIDCLFLLIIPYCLLLSFFARGYTWSLDFFVFGVVISISSRNQINVFGRKSYSNNRLLSASPLSR